jgi:hypothetical protein
MRRLIQDERGATIVIVAIVLVVLLGMVGLAVDAGALYAERRELRNGADAAVLAIAEDCALDAQPCTAAVAADTAGVFADLNARDGAAGVESVDLDLTAQTVRVVTRTEVAATGSIEFEPYFMQLLGIGGTTVRGAATAQWGVPQSMGDVLPLIISHCEWQRTAIDVPVTLYFHGQDDGTLACNALPGHDMDDDGSLPGGFGWLETESGCSLTLYSEDWFDNEPGIAVPQACKEMIAVGNTVVIPYFADADGFDGVQGTGGTGSYWVAGFGAFEIESYRFPGWVSPDAPCSGSTFCIRGKFTKASTDIGEFGTGQSYGIVLVKLIE